MVNSTATHPVPAVLPLTCGWVSRLVFELNLLRSDERTRRSYPSAQRASDSLISTRTDVFFVLTNLRQIAFRSVLVAKSPSSPSSDRLPPAGARRAAVDLGFIPTRAKLIEVAAFLDRVERYETADDFRCAALREAAALLVDGKPERARRILEKLSDPTTEPDAVSTGKAALGAWQKPAAPAPRGKKK